MLDAFGSSNQTRLFISLDITYKILSYYFKHTANKFAVLDRENVIAKLKCKNKIQEILLNSLYIQVALLLCKRFERA